MKLFRTESSRQRRRMPNYLFLTAVFFSQCITPIESFSSFLLSNTGCMTELSTDEVIMNNQVVDAEDSDRPMVHLVLTREEEQKKFIDKMETVQEISKIWLKPTQEELEFHIQMYVDNVKDLQFAMDTTPGAKFVNGQCENEKRVAGRGEDFVALRIPPSTTSTVQVWAGWATGHEKVRLTYPLEFIPAAAAAATGKSAEVEQAEGDTNNDNTMQQKQQQQQEKEGEPQEYVQTHANEKQNDAERWAEKMKMYQNAEVAKANIDEVQRQEAEEKRRELQHKTNDKSDHRKDGGGKKDMAEGGGSQSRSKIKGDHNNNKNHRKEQQKRAKASHDRRGGAAKNPRRTDSEKADKERFASHSFAERVKEKHRKVAERVASRTTSFSRDSQSNSEDGEAAILLDTTWFIYGLAVLVVGTFGALKCCLYASRKGDGKGRREL